MRKILGAILAVLTWWGTVGAAAALPPPPQRRVTDAQSHLSPNTLAQLDNRLATYEHTTGHQVLVWIGSSTGEIPLEDWAARTFASWKVGRKGLDDGLVLFLMAEDRRLRMEVGYGLEAQMPDAVAARIIRENIAPKLKEGDWDGAVSLGVDRILQTLGGESPEASAPRAAPVHEADQPMGPCAILFLIVLGLAILVFLVTHPGMALGLFFSILFDGFTGGSGGGGSGGGGWSGGGGSSGGGGASGSW